MVYVGVKYIEKIPDHARNDGKPLHIHAAAHTVTGIFLLLGKVGD